MNALPNSGLFSELNAEECAAVNGGSVCRYDRNRHLRNIIVGTAKGAWRGFMRGVMEG